ncbi:GNAT family N-acetyltransferase [Methylobacterium sp. JK268]
MTAATDRPDGGEPLPIVEILERAARVEGLPGGPLHVEVTRGDFGYRLVAPERDPERTGRAVAAVAEALTAGGREAVPIALACGDPASRAHLLAEGIAVPEGDALAVRPELTWQRSSPWLAAPRPPYPALHTITAGRRHPVRPPKPAGTVYRRRIPWLARELSFRVLDIDRDLPLFHRWMNDPRVDAVWEEAGDRDTHRRSLETRTADPHLLPLIGALDGVPFGYFELYWAAESRLGPHYAAEDHDRGWHVLIGEEAFRGRSFITAWLPSLMHYVFLDDPRTQRIVGEPRATHAQQIRNLHRAGFSGVKHFDFPHKRALLVMLLRERFFGERLWAPEAAP